MAAFAQAEIEEAIKRQDGFAEKLKSEPAKTITKLANEVAANQRALESDKWCYRGAVYALGIVLGVAILGGIAIAILGKTVPDLLLATAAAAVGALAGLVGPNLAGSQAGKTGGSKQG
jgi:hypothetical protein